MKTRFSRTVATATTAVAFILAAMPVHAQPPAQGPAAPSQNAFSFQHSGVTNILSNAVNQALSAASKKLPGIVSLSWSYDTWSPSMFQTQNQDRPNEFFVKMPYILSYTASVPLVGGLTITQALDVDVYCEGWQTGKGALTIRQVLYPPYFDQNQYSIAAEILQIPGLVNPYVEAALAQLPSGTNTSTTSQACYSLGVSGDAYLVDLSPTHRVTAVSSLLPEIGVRVLQVTRSSSSAYEPLETPHLDVWAGYSEMHLDLPPMVPGQSFVPTTNAVVQTPVPPSGGQLVLIADITYTGMTQEDSTFAVFGASSNFGNGTQTLTTQKSWFMPAQNGNKPYKVYVNGYDVTLQVTAPVNVLTTGTVSTPVIPVTPVRPVGTIGTLKP
ncbi:MAG TPA: hypothetical protein VKT49_15830 [Bryobacteraceae bacterium]|nr:hypothetical protein [Bryobacteraceae bacterium]